MTTPPFSLSQLWASIVKRNPRHRRFLEASVARLTEEEKAELLVLLQWAVDSGFSIERIAQGYTTIVIDTMKEQFFFNKHGRYRYSRFEEVAAKVYHNVDYMERYMLGLALSSYLWPNRQGPSLYHAAASWCILKGASNRTRQTS